MTEHDTREAWLNAAVKELRVMFSDADVDLPEKIRVSCGWSKRAGKGIGWCWKRSASADGTSEIFISPEIGQPIKALAILVHELVHAHDDGESKHAGEFRRVALLMGLEGKMTATRAGTALTAHLEALETHLGSYPHAELNPLLSAVPKQPTRMLKIVCPDDGYTVRTTKKWVDVGMPKCPCGEEMELS